MSDTEPSSSDTPADAAVPRPRWSRPDVWMLGVLSALGLIGFIATFILIVIRSPSVPVQRPLTEAEVQRLIGPRANEGRRVRPARAAPRASPVFASSAAIAPRAIAPSSAPTTRCC